MIHYSCDRCGRPIDPSEDLRYVVRLEIDDGVGSPSGGLELLEQHPATRRVVLSLFASSAYLSTIFSRHPDMIDTLVAKLSIRPLTTEPSLAMLMNISPGLPLGYRPTVM